MAEGEKRDSIISGVGYHDYVVLLCYTDAEWTRREPVKGEKEARDLFFRGFGHITRKCQGYKNYVNSNCDKFADVGATGGLEHISRYLFNPMCYVPFGHADELSIVLFDDFDPVHYLTADIKTTEEDISLGLCPRMKDIEPDESKGLFCELHTLLGGEGAKEPSVTDGQYMPAAHRFLEQSPLLMFTKYKINGLGTLGEGLLFQNALFRAMALRIKRVRDVMLNEVKDGASWDGWAGHGDVNSARVTFLDLQGPEEIGVLTFCRNYSVAMGFVAALRNLTFGDVFDADKEGYLVPALSRNEMHRSVIYHALEVQGKEPSEDINLLRDEHVFRWIHSSLAISAKAFIDADYSACNGFVEGLAEVKISPGHLKDFQGRVLTKADMGGKSPPVIGDMYRAVYCHTVGEGDFIFRYGSEGKSFELPVVPVGEVATVLKENRKRFGFQRDKAGRDVVDMTTTLTIPVPELKDRTGGKTEDLIFKGREGNHFSPLLELLREVQKRLCYPEEKKKDLPDAGRLDFLRLKKGHASYGLPVPLRRTIEYLYQDFATMIADPFLFDVALDLYDTFATLHAVLTEHLPKQLKDKDEQRLGVDLLLLEGERVEQIGMLVDAIHNALMHRIAKVYPECQVRDMAIDFRGGLNQVLLAVDAPMKCGLGLMRKYVLHTKRYDVVGVVTRVGFRPDVRCCSLRLKTEKEAQLAYYEVDVPHVLHVASYCDYLHEAFHLIFDALVSREPSRADFTPVMRDRMGEIFAILLYQILVFGSDTKAAMYHLIASYSRSLISIGVKDEDTIVRFTELMIRLFAVMDAVKGVMDVKIEDDPIKWSKREWPHSGEKVDDALERFKKIVSLGGPFFSEYERLWGKGQTNGRLDAGTYCWDQFRDIYPSVQERMPWIWSGAVKVFREYVKHTRWTKDSGYRYTDDEIRKVVDTAIGDGRPLIRGQFWRMSGAQVAARTGRSDGELDALFLVCKIFRSYISRIRNAEGSEVHLCRDKSRKVIYPKKGERCWYEFQLDRGAAGMFCPVPIERRKRLQRQIAVLKSLWDISSNLRARRLMRILDDNFARGRSHAR